jgi:hypothetical protein
VVCIKADGIILSKHIWRFSTIEKHSLKLPWDRVTLIFMACMFVIMLTRLVPEAKL